MLFTSGSQGGLVVVKIILATSVALELALSFQIIVRELLLKAHAKVTR